FILQRLNLLQGCGEAILQRLDIGGRDGGLRRCRGCGSTLCSWLRCRCGLSPSAECQSRNGKSSDKKTFDLFHGIAVFSFWNYVLGCSPCCAARCFHLLARPSQPKFIFLASCKL